MTDGDPTPPPAEPASAPAADAAAPAEADPLAEFVAPDRRSIWASVNTPFALGFYITLGALVAILLGLAIGNLSTVIIYIVLALFVALGLDPVVRSLERHKVSRAWGIVIVYFGFAVVLLGVLWLILPPVIQQVVQFVQDLPGTVASFQKTSFYQWIESTFGDVSSNLLSEVTTFVSNPSDLAALGGGLLQVGTTIASVISGIIIIIVLSLYFVATLPIIKNSFYQLAPARNRTTLASITEQITDSIGGYLIGMVILASANAVVAFFLHLILGLPFPALMAVVAFCITLIPLIGSVLYWIIATSVALITSPVAALIFAICYLIYMQLEAYVLTPRVMNRTISVPGSLVVIGALVGGTLLGLLGALVAIPVTASVLLIIKQVVIPRQDSKV